MGYTNFGKTIRKHMIDNDENLCSLANMFDVTTAFVSAVLLGKKPAPEEWYNILCEHYNLSEEERKKFYDEYCDTKKTVKIDVSNADSYRKKLAIQFQRKLSGLSEEELNNIMYIIGDDEV